MQAGRGEWSVYAREVRWFVQVVEMQGMNVGAVCVRVKMMEMDLSERWQFRMGIKVKLYDFWKFCFG